jgi:hypothetical protein
MFTKNTLLIIGGIMIIIAGIIGYQLNQPDQFISSVQRGGEYHANSNVVTSVSGVISANPATLGSVIITGTGGEMTIYDATSTNATLRTVSATTSLPILANFPASTAVGTYTFDVRSSYGLLKVIDGVSGTSTLTWRE